MQLFQGSANLSFTIHRTKRTELPKQLIHTITCKVWEGGKKFKLNMPNIRRKLRCFNHSCPHVMSLCLHDDYVNIKWNCLLSSYDFLHWINTTFANLFFKFGFTLRGRGGLRESMIRLIALTPPFPFPHHLIILYHFTLFTPFTLFVSF